MPNLIISFKENNIARWTKDGQVRIGLSDSGEIDPLWSDFARVLNPFVCVTNFTKAQVRLPPSSKGYGKYDELKWHAMDVSDTMFDHAISDLEEIHLKTATAQIARAKLDAITLDGHYKMPEAK